MNMYASGHKLLGALIFGLLLFASAPSDAWRHGPVCCGPWYGDRFFRGPSPVFYRNVYHRPVFFRTHYRPVHFGPIHHCKWIKGHWRHGHWIPRHRACCW